MRFIYRRFELIHHRFAARRVQERRPRLDVPLICAHLRLISRVRLRRFPLRERPAVSHARSGVSTHPPAGRPAVRHRDRQFFAVLPPPSVEASTLDLPTIGPEVASDWVSPLRAPEEMSDYTLMRRCPHWAMVN